MVDTKEFNWAIIGSGGIANQFARTLAQLDSVNLSGVLATSEAKGKTFIRELANPQTKASKVYADIDELLNDGHINAAYIATPHPAHYLYAKHLLQHGVPVLCEKPLTMTAPEAAELVSIAKQSNTFLMEAMWTKTLPAWQRVYDLLADQKIGTLDHLSADIGFLFPYQAQHRLFNPKLGGGVLLDLGVYPVSLAHSIVGNATSIASKCTLTDDGVDTKILLQMQYQQEVTASFYITSHSTASNRFCIYGDRGSIQVRDIFSPTQTIDIIVDGKTSVESFPYEATGFEYQIRQSMECIRAGQVEHPRVTHQSSIDVMRTLDAIRAQEGILPDFR